MRNVINEGDYGAEPSNPELLSSRLRLYSVQLALDRFNG